MALRVLLADESSTIKKVFQLALQDYAVDVRSVNVGVDVVPVAKDFKPDIVFADVLLQKRSGFDVSSDIKGDNALAETPVVLLWSGFLDMDDDKFQVSRANAKLEKPFDVKTLRTLIQQLVPKTQDQPLSEFIHFPKMPDILEDTPKEKPPSEETVPAGQSSTGKTGMIRPQQAFSPEDLVIPDDGKWNMDSFEKINTNVKSDKEEFSAVTLPAHPMADNETPVAESAEDFLEEDEADQEAGWVSQDLSRFETDLDPENQDVDLPVEYIDSDEPPPVTTTSSLDRAAAAVGEVNIDVPENNDDFEVADADLPPPAAQQQPVDLSAKGTISQEMIEDIVRQEAREVIEAVVWQVVPELASQLIEKEIHRLLDEKEI